MRIISPGAKDVLLMLIVGGVDPARANSVSLACTSWSGTDIVNIDYDKSLITISSTDQRVFHGPYRADISEQIIAWDEGSTWHITLNRVTAICTNTVGRVRIGMLPAAQLFRQRQFSERVERLMIMGILLTTPTIILVATTLLGSSTVATAKIVTLDCKSRLTGDHYSLVIDYDARTVVDGFGRTSQASFSTNTITWVIRLRSSAGEDVRYNHTLDRVTGQELEEVLIDGKRNALLGGSCMPAKQRF